jgi:hypothetical protein
MARLIRTDLIIVDDIGLLPASPDATEGFYRLVDAAYERRALAVSSTSTPQASTSRAERRPMTKADDVQMELSKRPLGVFSRQILLANTLGTEHIKADYDAGMLTLRIPIAERT